MIGISFDITARSGACLIGKASCSVRGVETMPLEVETNKSSFNT
jgi:hypothetical protein